MYYHNVKYFIVIFFITILITFCPFVVFAENIKTSIGIKANYSSGISDTNIAYKPFGRLGYEISFLNVEVTGTYTFHQQITDGMGNFTEINTGQGQIKTLLSLGDILDFGGGYSLAKGGNSYNSTMYVINGSLYIGDVTLDLDYTREDKKYFYNYDISIVSHTFIGSLSYDLTDVIGYELEYHYLSNNFSNLDYTYDKNIARFGISVYGDHTIYMAGINAGTDSGDYIIYGADVGLSKKVYDGIKVILTYNIDYYNPPAITSTSGGGHGGQNGGGYKGMNPFIRSDLAGKSFYSHSLSASLSYSF